VRSAAPKPVERLIEAFARLPGIGPKTASRLTYFLLRAPEGESMELAEALQEMRTHTRFCSLCFNITSNDADPCLICSDAGRDSSKICLVEEPLDVLALERTGEYSGFMGRSPRSTASDQMTCASRSCWAALKVGRFRN